MVVILVKALLVKVSEYTVLDTEEIGNLTAEGYLNLLQIRNQEMPKLVIKFIDTVYVVELCFLTVFTGSLIFERSAVCFDKAIVGNALKDTGGFLFVLNRKTVVF